MTQTTTTCAHITTTTIRERCYTGAVGETI
jgi:hypothetical protein